MQAQKQIKALILLVVFSLNTLMGMACAAGFNYQTKKSHEHPVSSTDKSHQHDHAKAHSHEHNTLSASHDHEAAIPDHHHNTSASHETPAEDDCCSDEVIKLNLLDKAINKVSQNNLPLYFSVIYLISDYLISTQTYSSEFARIKPPLLRSWPLAAHTDIRVVIQSFQI